MEVRIHVVTAPECKTERRHVTGKLRERSLSPKGHQGVKRLNQSFLYVLVFFCIMETHVHSHNHLWTASCPDRLIQLHY